MAANELGKTMSLYVALVSLLPAYLSLKNIKSHVWTFTGQLNPLTPKGFPIDE